MDILSGSGPDDLGSNPSDSVREMKTNKLVVSWTGGKDGCFACYKAILEASDWNSNSSNRFYVIKSVCFLKRAYAASPSVRV